MKSRTLNVILSVAMTLVAAACDTDSIGSSAEDERKVLRAVVINELPTTCLSLWTGRWLGGEDVWGPDGVALNRALAQSHARSRWSRPLNIEDFVDNLVKTTCAVRATLSRPRFFGGKAFIQLRTSRFVETIALRKREGIWIFIDRTILPIGPVL